MRRCQGLLCARHNWLPHPQEIQCRLLLSTTANIALSQKTHEKEWKGRQAEEERHEKTVRQIEEEITRSEKGGRDAACQHSSPW